MSKFLLNLCVQISKALVNSKIQLCGPLGLWPSQPPLASLLPQAEAHRPAQATRPMRAVGVFAEIRFLL
jgi:hypothetical protein